MNQYHIKHINPHLTDGVTTGDFFNPSNNGRRLDLNPEIGIQYSLWSRKWGPWQDFFATANHDGRSRLLTGTLTALNDLPPRQWRPFDLLHPVFNPVDYTYPRMALEPAGNAYHNLRKYPSEGPPFFGNYVTELYWHRETPSFPPPPQPRVPTLRSMARASLPTRAATLLRTQMQHITPPVGRITGEKKKKRGGRKKRRRKKRKRKKTRRKRQRTHRRRSRKTRKK